MFFGRVGGFAFLVSLGISMALLQSQFKRTTHNPLVTQTLKTVNPELLNDLDAENQDIVKSVSPDIDIKVNPLLANIVQASRLKPNGAPLERKPWPLRAQHWYQSHVVSLTSLVKGAPVVLLGLSMLALGLGRKDWGRCLAALCFSLSTKWLIFLSLVSLAVVFTGRFSVTADLPLVFWMAPVLSVLLSAALLTVMDMNYPFWNSTLFSFALPLATNCAAVVISKLKG